MLGYERTDMTGLNKKMKKFALLSKKERDAVEKRFLEKFIEGEK